MKKSKNNKKKIKIDKKKIKINILKYLKNKNPIISKLKKIPEDKSLLELGYIDSFGLIELIEFIEKKFHIKIKENELTFDAFGSINKICDLVFKKIK
tara:strand:+ start:343 stop:633 length:291 start_codon:yes stop_codon:yes gene_type:complete